MRRNAMPLMHDSTLAPLLARFLSPQVLTMVRERGMETALRGERLELSAVFCDLRGFTRFTQSHPTEHALELLRDYYKVVGRAAAAVGGTLKDFVGDGALILMGAPAPVAQHADVALGLADTLREDIERILMRWTSKASPLGIGIGVASGEVQVGVVASESRYEYVAVGPAVNVASRLCESAEDGQILVAPETVRMLSGPRDRLQRGPLLSLKGVRAPVQTTLLKQADVLPGWSPFVRPLLSRWRRAAS